MKEKTRGRIQGITAGIIAALVLSGTAVYGANTQRMLEANYNDIKIVVDGTQITPKDGNGNTVDPFIVDGTTYLPVRAVANAMGKEVYWDGPNYTVYIGNMGGAIEYPTLKIEDAVNISSSLSKADKRVDNYDNSYIAGYGISANGKIANRYFQTLLNMKYSRFKGTIYVPQGTSTSGTCTVIIEVDGNVVYSSPEITKVSSPIFVDVSVVGGNDFRIYTTSDNYNTNDHRYNIYPCIGDAGFYQ